MLEQSEFVGFILIINNNLNNAMLPVTIEGVIGCFLHTNRINDAWNALYGYRIRGKVMLFLCKATVGLIWQTLFYVE